MRFSSPPPLLRWRLRGRQRQIERFRGRCYRFDGDELARLVVLVSARMAKDIPDAVRLSFLIDRPIRDTGRETGRVGENGLSQRPSRVEAHLARPCDPRWKK